MAQPVDECDHTFGLRCGDDGEDSHPIRQAEYIDWIEYIKKNPDDEEGFRAWYMEYDYCPHCGYKIPWEDYGWEVMR